MSLGDAKEGAVMLLLYPLWEICLQLRRLVDARAINNQVSLGHSSRLSWIK